MTSFIFRSHVFSWDPVSTFLEKQKRNSVVFIYKAGAKVLVSHPPTEATYMLKETYQDAESAAKAAFKVAEHYRTENPHYSFHVEAKYLNDSYAFSKEIHPDECDCVDKSHGITEDSPDVITSDLEV